MRRTLARSYSAEQVAAWSVLTGDGNPLHTDRDYAARTRFGVPVVHGHLLACEVLDQLPRRGTEGRSGRAVEVRFRRPVPVGSTVEYHWRDDGAEASARCAGVEAVQVRVWPISEAPA